MMAQGLIGQPFSLEQLLRGPHQYCAVVQGDCCMIAYDDDLVRMAPRFVAALPEWGMSAGLLIAAHTWAEIAAHLATHPDDFAVTLYDLETSSSRSGQVAELIRLQ